MPVDAIIGVAAVAELRGLKDELFLCSRRIGKEINIQSNYTVINFPCVELMDTSVASRR
jgi:hypothetical protein